MVTHSSILAGESHGQRSLVGYSPWGHKELDTTQRLTLLLFTFKKVIKLIVVRIMQLCLVKVIELHALCG